MTRMSFLSDISLNDKYNDYYTDDLKPFKKIESFTSKYVIKSSEGAMSVGVELSKNKQDLIDKIKIFSSTKNFKLDIKDGLRTLKHKRYIKESVHRKKYVIQNFIPNLKNDWKILIFGDRYYIIYRETRDNDFRASGSGKLLLNDELPIQDGILNLAKKVYDSFDTPHLSVDIMFDGTNFHVVEFQFLYFGTSSHSKSESYFKLVDSKWERIYEKLDLEEVYVDSIVKFIDAKESK